MPEIDPFILRAASGACAFFAAGGLLLLIRVLRVRRWRAALEAPAREAKGKKRRPRWARVLPEEADLDTEKPLFETLYRYHRTRPKVATPHPLRLALKLDSLDRAGGADSASGKGAPAGTALSDEEKIGHLLSAPDAAAAAGLPTSAIAQNLVVNLLNVLRGKKKLTVGIEHAVLDSLAPGGGFAGAKLGGAIGLSLAPLWLGLSTVFVPVGIFVGAWLGAHAGKRIGGKIKSRRRLAALRKLRRASTRFHRWFLKLFPDFLRQLDREYADAVAETRDLGRAGQRFFTRVFFPDVMTVFFGMSRERLERDRLADRARFERIREEIRVLDPLAFAGLLEALDESAVASNPELSDHRRAYVEALRELREADSASDALQAS